MVRRHSLYTIMVSMVCAVILLLSYNAIGQLILRNSPSELKTEDIMDSVIKNNFFDINLNSEGNFQNDFIDNDNGTITDQSTGLMWEKDGSKKDTVWRKAEKYIQELNRNMFAGYDNWRLPTIDELYTLLEPTQMHGLFIDPIFSSKAKTCWTSDKGLSVVDMESYGAAQHKSRHTKNNRLTISFKKGHISEAIIILDSHFASSYNLTISSHVRAVRSIE